MNELEFKNTAEFADWSSNKDIFNMEYLGTLEGRKSQNCFEVDIEKEKTQLICIKKNANELFFMSQNEMEQWIELNDPEDVINNGLSVVYIGFNLFHCKLGGLKISLMIDATALINDIGRCK